MNKNRYAWKMNSLICFQAVGFNWQFLRIKFQYIFRERNKDLYSKTNYQYNYHLCVIFDMRRLNIMKKEVIHLSLTLLLLLGHNSYAQEVTKTALDEKTTELFKNSQILPIQLNYSNKHIKRNTNDSTYVSSELSYKLDDGSWKTLKMKIRARGNNRLKNCYFAPLKIKLKKKEVAGTLFEGHKKLKLVLPCLRQEDNNDNILKEYLAYKLYEVISPYHYKTRLVTIDYTDQNGNREKEHTLLGILIEDLDNIAARHNGAIIERSLHPLTMDDLCAAQNDFFQYMIGNTDYSTAYQHNQKLLFIDKKIIPVPYDFDMSGLVDASYATVPTIEDTSLHITSVTQRLFRGFQRELSIFYKLRESFLGKKTEMLDVMDRLEVHFDNSKEFTTARDYMLSFFEVLQDSEKFKSEILQKARIK